MNILPTICVAGLVGLLGAGCATSPPLPPPPISDLFSDDTVRPPSQPVTAAGLFDLSPAMKAHLDTEHFRREVRLKGPELGLTDALYAKDGLQLTYDNTATRDAAETFTSKRGNCLSLVIMTAAFAKALKLNVMYHDVLIDTEWSRAGGIYVGSNHVNLSLATSEAANFDLFKSSNRITVDFMPPAQAAKQRTVNISENMITAMYLNNRAAEELFERRLDDAYWWARAAVRQDPNLSTALNTLGAVYQRRGQHLMAERVFKRALQRQPEDVMLMKNLVPVLHDLGKHDESRALAARAARLEPEPPFYHFQLGMQALLAENYAEAKKRFAREVKRSPFDHEMRYWLSIAHLRLGEQHAARKEMAIALENSTSAAATERYSAKLAHLRALR